MNKILIVEDETAIRNNIEIFLKTEGFDVISAPNGLEALRIIEKIIPDLIISDIMMPYMDGLEFFEKTKQKYGKYRIPFVFLTAKNNLQSIRLGMNLGAEDYITKPFEFSDLIEAVKKGISKRQFYLGQFEELKATISKNIPHELRTPLVSIFGYTGYLLHDIDLMTKNEIHSYLSAIAKAGVRLHERIEKFLVFTGVELDLHSKTLNGAYVPSPSNIESRALLQQTKEIAAVYNRLNDLTAEIEDACVDISDEHIHFLFNELIDNAFKFSSSGSNVTVYGKSESDKYTITITDNGRGLSAEEISSITSYRQFNREHYQQCGVGLGLYIAKNIVELNNGRFSITSAPQKGTTIKITININNKGVQNELV